MDNLIINNWHKCVDVTRVMFKNDIPYFFLKGETPVSDGYSALAKAFKAGQLRHCVVSNGKFYDFLEQKLYDSLQDWAGDLDNVMFGINRIRENNLEYIPLRVLIGHLSIQE